MQFLVFAEQCHAWQFPFLPEIEHRLYFSKKREVVFAVPKKGKDHSVGKEEKMIEKYTY